MAERDTPTRQEKLDMANRILADCQETRARIDEIERLAVALVQEVELEKDAQNTRVSDDG